MKGPINPGSRLFIMLYLQFLLHMPGIQKLLAEFLCHRIDLCYILITKRRHNLHIILKPCNVFALLEHSFHDFSCGRCPASVLDEADGTVLDGVGEFTVGGVKHVCKAGEALVMPATIPHAVYAVERFKMLLTVVFPIEK